MRAALAIAAACLAAIALAACGGDAGGRAGAEVRAVATTTHAADLLRQVGGERVEVHTLLAPGTDPHDYEPRPSDARAIAEADLVVRSGGDLDAWLGDVVDNAGGDAETLTLIDHVRALDPEHGDAHADHGGEDGRNEAADTAEVDPHWWHDPRNAVRAVAAIRDALAAADPEGRDAYARNARAYAGRLERLDREIADCMRSVPEERRKLVTTHDSFGYYAARYDIEVLGALIPSLSSQAQPSSGDVDELVRAIRDEDVAAIFPESALDPRLERAVAREAGARIGGTLWADSLGRKGSGADTYLAAMAANTETLVRGFTGGRTSCRPRA